MKQRVDKTRRYMRIWWSAIRLHFGVLTASRLDFLFFFIGKVVRMLFFLVFFLSLFSITPTIAGYTKGEVLLFFATMNLIDNLGQLFWFRGLTVLPDMVRNGDFDLLLTKPVSSLFLVAFHVFDFFDLTTMPVSIGLFWYAVQFLPSFSFLQWFAYASFFLCSISLAFSLNLFLASLTFYAVQSANLWWTYRDLLYVSRFPPEIFPTTVRRLFTYAAPILLIVSFPVKALLGKLSVPLILYAVGLTVFALVFAVQFWHRGLRAYASASS